MKVVEFTIPVVKEHSIHVQEDKLPHFYEHLHRHNETQITWVKKGEGTLIAGNNMRAFHEGDIFILGANQPHLFKSDPAYFKKDNAMSIHSLNIFFDPKGFLSTLLSFPEMAAIKKFIDTSIYGMQACAQHQKLLTDYIFKIAKQTQGYRLSAFIELLQTMASLKDWEYLSKESFKYTITDYEGLRMNDIYQYTMANYNENIMLEEIAAVIYLTPQSFCRYFKKHTLKTYTEFLNEVRINEACKKFMTNDFSSISAVAYQSGFNNVVTFNRVFRSIMKKSPGQFIKEYRNKVESTDDGFKP
jgi:AraC-like DNA-binding protein